MKRFVAHLLPAILAIPLAATSLVSQAPKKTLTVEDIFAHGPLIGTPPRGLTWSPDGLHLTYLDGGELVDMDPGSGKPHVLVGRAKLATLAGAKARRTQSVANFIADPAACAPGLAASPAPPGSG